jgi:hypothetical protein
MQSVYPFVVASLLGAVAQEISHWYELRAKLKAEDFQNILKATSYWMITVAMSASSVCFPFIWFWGRTSVEPRDYLIYSLAFPLILRKAILTQKAISGGPTLGARETGPQKPIQSYFSI